MPLNQENMINMFLELVKISSPSLKEGELAGVLKKKLEELGLTVRIDNAGTKVGGVTGNIIAELSGNVPGPRLLLSAHMDTVYHKEEIKPVIANGYIRSEGDTILGADDKSGIAVILEVLRVIKTDGIKHPDIIVTFTIGEEEGLLGARNIDQHLIRADYGFVLDSSGPVGNVIIKGPTQSDIKAIIKGKAAHAGIVPEQGISAIQIAAEAIRRMKLGRIDAETTANIGRINGGKATNIIPEEAVIEGEARSLSPEKLKVQNELMKNAFIEAAKEMGGRAFVEIGEAYPPIGIVEDSSIVNMVKEAGAASGIEVKLVSTGGGSDANIYNGYGISTVNLATGMEKVHTSEENIQTDDFLKLSRLLLAIIQMNAGQAG